MCRRRLRAAWFCGVCSDSTGSGSSHNASCRRANGVIRVGVKTLSVKLTEPLAQWLAGEAILTRRSRSQIVREALESRRHAHGKKWVTMAQAMADLKGAISGPRDLSTDPKYLDGLGR